MALLGGPGAGALTRISCMQGKSFILSCVPEFHTRIRSHRELFLFKIKGYTEDLSSKAPKVHVCNRMLCVLMQPLLPVHIARRI